VQPHADSLLGRCRHDLLLLLAVLQQCRFGLLGSHRTVTTRLPGQVRSPLPGRGSQVLPIACASDSIRNLGNRHPVRGSANSGGRRNDGTCQRSTDGVSVAVCPVIIAHMSHDIGELIGGWQRRPLGPATICPRRDRWLEGCPPARSSPIYAAVAAESGLTWIPSRAQSRALKGPSLRSPT